jgi:hypothetical protein
MRYSAVTSITLLLSACLSAGCTATACRVPSWRLGSGPTCA